MKNMGGLASRLVCKSLEKFATFANFLGQTELMIKILIYYELHQIRKGKAC